MHEPLRVGTASIVDATQQLDLQEVAQRRLFRDYETRSPLILKSVGYPPLRGRFLH